jgi:hypothetical protein
MTQVTVYRTNNFLQKSALEGTDLTCTIYVGTDVCLAILKYQIKPRLLTH